MKKGVVFSLLTILLVLFVIFAGIPFLVQMVTFLGELKSSTEIIETEDTTPPLPPKLRPLPEATNKSTISLYGFAEPGTLVKIFLNQELEKEVVAGADGSFTLEEINLSLGKNKIQARAKDKAGNESQDSGTIIIEYDETPPELEIKSPEDGSSFPAEEKEVEIVGQTEPGASLKINDRFVILDPEGNFSYSFTLAEGENKIFFEVEDRAGNKTEREIKIHSQSIIQG